MASIRVIRRKDTGTLWLTGTVNGRRIRQAAGTESKRLAAERAAQLETELFRTDWHGERRGSRSFGEAVLSYAEAQERRPAELDRLMRLVKAIGEKTQLRAIDQDTVTRIGAGRKPGTVQREVITPLRAVLMHAARRKWCDVPLFDTQRQSEGRTLFLLPEDAERLVRSSAEHLRSLLLFLLGTGARLSEALELDWRDVDLAGAKVIFWRTKNGKRRVATLPPRVVLSLSELRRGESRFPQVFLSSLGEPYADRRARGAGGQIAHGFAGAIKRAGLEAALTPHCLRHTWATWHYALHRDLLSLKQAGGWGSVALVERYAHLMPAGQETAIREFLGLDGARLRVVA